MARFSFSYDKRERGCSYFMKKLLLLVLLYIVSVVIFIPAMVTLLFHGQKNDAAPNTSDQNQTTIEVFHPDIIHSDNSMEEYIKGVVAAEMPALFPEEALKAQAVAARTYTVHSLNGSTTINPDQIGQAYHTIDELKQNWGDNFPEYYKKISDAVDSTYGEIMVYHDEPILAVFHAESAGKTETAENVWEQEIPYLKSVDSSLDENAPDFEKESILSNQDVKNAFVSKFGDIGLDTNNLCHQIQILSRSPSGYIQQIKVGTTTLTGKQVRETLGLRSANFTITQKDQNSLCFTTKGYGHGAGMSQYGASFMAEKGKSYREILQHYYTGIQFEKWKKIDSYAE